MVFDAILVIALPVAFLVATLIYGFGSPFWKHPTGVGLFTVLATTSIITGLAGLQAVGIYNHWAARAAYCLAIAAAVVMTVIIRRTQLEDRDQDDGETTGETARTTTE